MASNAAQPLKKNGRAIQIQYTIMKRIFIIIENLLVIIIGMQAMIGVKRFSINNKLPSSNSFEFSIFINDNKK